MKWCIFALTLLLPYAPAFSGDAPGSRDAKGHGAGMVKAAEKPGVAKSTSPAEPAAKDAVTDRVVTKEEIGRKAVCPVTKEEFKVSAATPSVSYKGKVYYFCCDSCPPAFRANPGKYAVKGPDQRKPAAKKHLYVCPMGDYQGDKPGKCPKCGMTLVEKK